MNKPVIQFQNVSFSYEKKPILQNVSFTILPNQFIGIIGPNGSGKTTALKLMMGFLYPKRGTVSLFGCSPEKMRTQIGYVPQAHHYDKDFPISVLEVVLTGYISKRTWWGKISKEIKKSACEILEKMGLLEMQAHSFGCLSGGQMQKVLIARALISNPTLLLLDEPTANIDIESENAIFELLAKLTTEKTILIVTHNFDAILRYVERVLCFQQEVVSLAPQELCKHFTIGMYHPLKTERQNPYV